ncbi:hypothetical protein HYH03_008960 [Edaphochlamys debaryana]|uniref:BZIP domain-containing protein n=1 Tax=Edaphochlamys debaryana TaxID=47281 RepID=A0A835Y5D8_9CHLO|nr:hypothetical protein HYH03_008960 [Edaphochlamys debaryana]|eukprot:KAG2492800.1 hypothetical protein HYH03_008960 [Edaphochlamys debaryana]
MEDLGGLASMGSIGEDWTLPLEGFMSGTSVGAGLDQPFLGELEAIASRLEMPYEEPEPEPEPATAIKVEEPPCTSAAALQSPPLSEDEDGTRSSGPKRRRRIRTERQQVLNRLAQQRYRQRKKEKVQALQTNVATLQEQLDRLALLEVENVELRNSAAKLSSDVAGRDAQLAAAAAALRNTQLALKSTSDRCAAAERTVSEQQQTIEGMRSQLRSSTLAGMDPQALSDRLLAIIKEALADVSASGSGSGSGSGQAGGGACSMEGVSGAGGSGAQSLVSEAVIERIGRTLTSCCRELVYATKGLQSSATSEAPAAIPVSCC